MYWKYLHLNYSAVHSGGGGGGGDKLQGNAAKSFTKCVFAFNMLCFNILFYSLVLIINYIRASLENTNSNVCTRYSLCSVAIKSLAGGRRGGDDTKKAGKSIALALRHARKGIIMRKHVCVPRKHLRYIYCVCVWCVFRKMLYRYRYK